MIGWHAKVRARLGAFVFDVDLEGPPGVLAVIGPNGSGKTTLLRVLAGAVVTEHAEITVGERTLASSSRGIEVPIEQRRVGYVPQSYGLFGHLDVLDNIAFGLSTGSSAQPRKLRRERARTLLETLDCGALAMRTIEGLSGGEQQRVALARALITDPAMLLLDEPLAALDPGARRVVRLALAKQLCTLGRPAVVVTHDVRDVAALDARVCVMERGRVLRCDTLGALRADPRTDFVREFVDDAQAPSQTR